MTFSLIARCPDTGQFGIAAATAVPAVGKLLTHAVAGLGAVATQARINPYLGIDGVQLFQNGRPACEVLEILAERDPAVHDRQFAVIDREHRDLSVQGNRLDGEHVLEALEDGYRRAGGKGFDERLMEALEAAERVGGDRKGERSAAIYIVDKEEYPLWDIRVDANPDPFRELRRLHDIFARKLIPEMKHMPTRTNPAGDPKEHDV